MQQRDGQTQEICFGNDANEFVVPIEDGQTAVLVPVEALRRFPEKGIGATVLTSVCMISPTKIEESIPSCSSRLISARCDTA